MEEELKNGTKITFEHGEFNGHGQISGIHYQYVNFKEEPYIFYIVEGYDFPNDVYDYTHILIPEKNIKIIE
jgi:hypothetical protein